MKLLLPILLLAFAGCMKVPEGVHVYVTDTGCTTTNYCPFEDGAGHNFYFAPTREIVLMKGQRENVLQHEMCHAHQHQTILDETGQEPSDLTLREWMDTDEARSYRAVVEAAGPPEWGKRGEFPLLEDFSESCGRYLAKVSERSVDTIRATWFAERGF